MNLKLFLAPESVYPLHLQIVHPCSLRVWISGCFGGRPRGLVSRTGPVTTLEANRECGVY